jgi:hypothetical protein
MTTISLRILQCVIQRILLYVNVSLHHLYSFIFIHIHVHSCTRHTITTITTIVMNCYNFTVCTVLFQRYSSMMLHESWSGDCVKHWGAANVSVLQGVPSSVACFWTPQSHERLGARNLDDQDEPFRHVSTNRIVSKFQNVSNVKCYSGTCSIHILWLGHSEIVAGPTA